MKIRPLTQEEKIRIREAKTKANAIIGPKIKYLRQRLKIYSESPRALVALQRLELEEELSQTKRITGNPVTVTHNGQSIILDYNKLQKLLRTLKPDLWTVTAKIKSANRPELKLSYRKREPLIGAPGGTTTLYELPERELLQDLPVVELEG